MGPTGDRKGAFVFTLRIFDSGLPQGVQKPLPKATRARTSGPTEGFAAQQRPQCARRPWEIQRDSSLLKRNSGCYKRRADSRGCKVGSSFMLVGGNILPEGEHQIINYLRPKKIRGFTNPGPLEGQMITKLTLIIFSESL